MKHSRWSWVSGALAVIEKVRGPGPLLHRNAWLDVFYLFSWLLLALVFVSCFISLSCVTSLVPARLDILVPFCVWGTAVFYALLNYTILRVARELITAL